MNISSNVSSLQAHSAYANQNAHNIANVNTDGFVPSRTQISEQGDSVRASFVKADNTGGVKSQTNLTKEIPEPLFVRPFCSVIISVFLLPTFSKAAFSSPLFAFATIRMWHFPIPPT